MSKKGTKGEVIWTPHPGSQVLFLTCPVYEVLLSGARGSGKTECLLIDFAKDVGKGYGASWFGVLFRQSFPQLKDVVRKSMRLFPRMFPGCTFNKNELSWTFPQGEELSFRFINDPNDYWNYHGWEIPWCVSHDTNVRMADGSTKMIRDIQVGEQVMTLEGPKPVLRVKHSFKPAVEASFFDGDAQLLGTQIQGEEHRILSVSGMHTGYSQDSSHVSAQSLQNLAPWLGYKSLQDVHLHNLQASLHGQNQGGLEGLNPLLAIDEYYGRLSSYLFQIFLQSWRSQPPYTKSILDHSWFLKSVENFFSHIDGHTFLPKEVLGCNPEFQRFLLYDSLSSLKQFLSLNQKMGASASDCEFPYEFYERLIQDWINNRLMYSSRNDGQSLQGLKTDPNNAPQLSENVLPIFHLLDKDGSESSHKYDLSTFYTHPYSKELRHTTVNFSSELASCKFTPLNRKIHLVDLTIADASHYVTDLRESQLGSSNHQNGSKSIVNMNCGFEELTNWPTDECYEAMKTCCRSSVPGIPKRLRATTNPYGRGHSWIKRYFIDATPPTKPIIENNQARTWIDSSIFENKTLIENDEHYLSTLQNIKDPNKKKAWLEGRWDIESGTMIGDIWEPKLHILPTFQIPKSWVVNRSFDWGYSHPFSLGYWAESDGTSVTIPNLMGKERTITFPRGTMFRVGELYGTNGEINTGLRCTPQQVGRMIWKKDYSMPHIKGCMIIPGPADNQIFDEQYDGKTLQASMLEAYKYAKFSKSNKHPHSRAIGSILIRQRLENSLKLAEQGFMEHPGLFIMDNCNHWRSIVPSLLRSELDPDDIMQNQEDHLWDETRYEVLSRIADTSKRTHTQGL